VTIKGFEIANYKNSNELVRIDREPC